MKTTSDKVPCWKRYLSLRILADKVQKKGIIWCFKVGVGKVYRLLSWAILNTVALPLDWMGIKFLSSDVLLARIGHLALEPDIYVKSDLLGWRPRYRGVILAPTDRVVNHSLLNYWSQYIRILDNALLVKLFQPLSRVPRLHYNTYFFDSPDGDRVKISPAVYSIQTRYEAEYEGQPLLTLSPAHYERGWRCLQELGVPRDAWFVCLHVREGGYLQRAYHSYRNADVNTYLLAVEAIIERGGWVIRMGDPTMKPLPDMGQVIDYVHSNVRSDWMDVFCFAQCEFFLGTSSGPFNVAFVFGVPCALANFVWMGHGAYSSRDIWIPKLYWSTQEDRYLTFAEVLGSPTRRINRTAGFEAAGISLVDNSPEEIRDLAVEMMDRLEDDLYYTAEDEHLQKYFQELLGTDPMYRTRARVGRDFLRKYAWLLPDRAPENSNLTTVGRG